ncbi:MAG: AI-2E family transporter [Bryobacteraceae bacterium]
MAVSRRASDSSALTLFVMVAGSVAVLYLARDVLIPFAVALTLTFLLTPLVRLLQRAHLPRVVAVLVVILVSSAFAVGLGWVLGGQLFSLANDLPKYRANIDARIQGLRMPKSPLRQAANNVKEIGQEISGTQALPPPAPPILVRGKRAVLSTPTQPGQVEIVQADRSDLQYLLDLGTPIVRPLATVGLVLVFTIFMLIEKSELRNRLLRLAGVKRLNTVTVALDDAAKRVSKYLLMQLLVNVSFGVLFSTGLFFIGVPNAALWGALGAVLRIVPYVGSPIAAAFPLMLSLAVFPGWVQPLLVVALFATLELVISNLVEPLLYGANTGISPLAILVTTVFWTILWGPAGLILSTPLTVCAGVLGRYFPQLSFLHILLGDEPALEPAAAFYQRLLALDHPEAHNVAELFLKDHPLVGLYDSVLIPALAMAERDRHEGSLDHDREQFIFLNFTEMIAEYADYRPELVLAAKDGSATPSEPQTEIQPMPVFAGRILCVPASDEADSITASMLAQLLEQGGHSTITLPIESSMLVLQALSPAPDDVICISALPPFALARSKALSRELRTRFPKVPAIVGIWGFIGEGNQASAQPDAVRAEKVLTTLADALERIDEIKTGSNKTGADKVESALDVHAAALEAAELEGERAALAST